MEDIFNIEDLKLESTTLDQIMNKPVEDNTEDNSSENNQNTETEKEVLTKETKTEIPDKDKITPSSSQKEDSSTFSVFANLLKEEGVISLDEEELKDIDLSKAKGLVDLVKKQLEKSRFENLSESQKRYLEAVEAGVPQADFEKIEKQLNRLESIDEKLLEGDEQQNIQARFDLIAHDYIAKGINKEKAIELANRSIKLGTDVDDAKEALDSLIKIKSEEYKQTILSKKENNKVSLEKLKETIESKDTVLKDIKLTPKQKTDLYNLLSIKADSDEAGQPINELNKWRKDNNLEAEIILGALYLQTNKFQNLGKILDVSKSKAAQELEKRLKQNEINDVSNDISYNNDKYQINI